MEDVSLQKKNSIEAIEAYIEHYNTELFRRKPDLMTPAEHHDHYRALAKVPPADRSTGGKLFYYSLYSDGQHTGKPGHVF